MASWIQNQLKAAEDLLQAVDRTAQKVSNLRDRDDRIHPDSGPGSGSRSVGGRESQASQFREVEGSGGNNLRGPPLKPLPSVRRVAGTSPSTGRGSTSPKDTAPPAHLTQSDDERGRSSAQGTTPAVSRPKSSLGQTVHKEGTAIPFSRKTAEREQASASGAVEQKASVHEGVKQEPSIADVGLQSVDTHKSLPTGDSLPIERTSDGETSSRQPEGATAKPEPGSEVQPPSNGHLKASVPSLRPTEGEASKEEALPPKGIASGRSFTLDDRETSDEHEEERGSCANCEQCNNRLDTGAKNGDAGTGEEDGGGHSAREARLVKMMDNLKRRLEQLKAENVQLEEMLRHADARASGGATDVERLEDALARADVARISAEAALSSGLAAKEVELEAARRQLEAARREASSLSDRIAALEDANQHLIAERQASEGQILQAMREEVVAVEARLEEERAAHARTRKEFSAREQEIEVGVADSASALTEMQRNLLERTRKLDSAEARVTTLEAGLATLQRENASLREAAKECQEAGAGFRQREAVAHSGSGAVQEMAALKAMCDQLRAAARAAAASEAAARAEAAAARQEADGLRQDLAQAASNAILQEQFKEVTELLYLKQTQLEKMAADKAAHQLALERELAIARDEAERVRRRAKNDRASASLSEGDVVVPMEAMGEAYYRLANNNRVGGAVKAAAGFMDASASTAVRILKQYPLGRLVVFAYIVGIHLFIWLLLSRLQHKALSAERRLGLDRMPE